MDRDADALTCRLVEVDNAVGYSGQAWTTLADRSGNARERRGKTDTVGFTLWDGDMLLFSSDWDGAMTVETILHRGNIGWQQPVCGIAGPVFVPVQPR